MFVDMEWYRRKKCPECTTSSFTPKWGIRSPWVFVSLRNSFRICFKCFNTSEKLALRNWVFKSKVAICFLDKLFQNRPLTTTTKHLSEPWPSQPNIFVTIDNHNHNQTTLTTNQQLSSVFFNFLQLCSVSGTIPNQSCILCLIVIGSVPEFFRTTENHNQTTLTTNNIRCHSERLSSTLCLCLQLCSRICFAW